MLREDGRRSFPTGDGALLEQSRKVALSIQKGGSSNVKGSGSQFEPQARKAQSDNIIQAGGLRAGGQALLRAALPDDLVRSRVVNGDRRLAQKGAAL